MKGVEVIEKEIDLKDLKNGRVIVWKPSPYKVGDEPKKSLILNGKIYNLVRSRFEDPKELKEWGCLNGKQIAGIAKSTTAQVFIKERRK